MQPPSKEKLRELQDIISKMSLQLCCIMVLPEFGVSWRDVSQAVRNARLPMLPGSVARVLCRHVAKSMPVDKVVDIIARLKLILVATQDRKWYVIDLSDPIEEEISIAYLMAALPDRVAKALSKSRVGKTKRPEVQTIKLGDLIYMSVQLVSDSKQSSALYVASPPGEPVALVSSVSSSMLRACVEGLGYKKHEDAKLDGQDIRSLLRIHNTNWNENADHLAGIPEYAPVPVLTSNGIDYTNKAYDEQYIENILGPDPPLLTDLTITSVKPFFDPSRLNKTMNLKVTLKSENIANTLKAWVGKGALAPTSDFFQIFHKIKSNTINLRDNEEDTLT